MNAFVLTMLAGIAGTSGMSLAMWIITKSGIAHVSMIRAIGSIFTQSYDNSFAPGLMTHFISGILFAILYIILLSLFAPATLAGAIGAGAMIGAYHGVVFGFFLVVTVAEHHPLAQFRNAGFEVAIAHFVGLVLYGSLVGLVFGLTGARIFLLS